MCHRKWEDVSLSVFFPCHNEEDNVERVTLSALRACERLVGDYEVIIVNDGSKDATGRIADRLASEHQNVRVVHNSPNRGYGGALQSGFAAAQKDFVFYTDGDGQFDLEELETVLPLIDQYDIVSGYRMNRQDSFMRKLNAKCWGWLVNKMFALNIRDVDGAFKIYPKYFLDQVELKSNGALIDTEMLAKAKRLGFSVGQTGVHHYPRTAGEQSGANLRVIVKAFLELFRLRRHIVSTCPKGTGRTRGSRARRALTEAA
ncbi:MAG: glycosyltransferase family 2 protein [Planctomycetota bacterium]|jgi:glycosyltransferase involved in cell wall biosynthesis